jgi:nucleoside-diphosphate-sugar epimerase
MKILLTGGTGSVGRAAVARLVDHGHDVLVIGRRAGLQIPGARYASCDITDYPALRDNARGCQAIVHLAAIPNPSAGEGQEIFRVNAEGTFNVFQAATEAGIRRVVQASSINALGMHWGIKPARPQYFPMDEAHPCITTDAYSFSKTVVEAIGDYFWRREGISSVALRLPAVWRAGNDERMAETRTTMRRMVDRLLALPEDERRQAADEMVATLDDIRGRRLLERLDARESLWGQGSRLDPETRLLMGHRNNLWTVIDERDSAQAMEKALVADYEGCHPLFVHDRCNTAGIESETLLALFWRDVKERKRPLVGSETLISIARARQLIGFEPEYSYG